MISDKEFTELFNKWKPKLIAYFRSKWPYRTIEEIEDVVQESFIKAYQSQSWDISKGYFSTWLYKIAINTMIDYTRKNKKREYNKSLHIIMEHDREIEYSRALLDNSKNPERLFIEKENKIIIINLIKLLNVKYSKTINLFVKGENYNDIARILNIPLGTVKVRIFRAREQIRELMNRSQL